MKAYWWRGSSYPNLGDELTPLVLDRLFGIRAEHSALNKADFAATGSLLGWLWDDQRPIHLEKALQIAGSGFMTPDAKISQQPNARIHSVRGYLSKNKLGRLDAPNVTVGDPGLLASELVQEGSDTGNSGAKYGVILHHRHSDNTQVMDRFTHLDAEFIDIRTRDIDSFVNALRRHKVIISQSLHGLIIADAMGIPNAWLELGPIHSGGSFKFLDYFSTVARAPYNKLSSVPRTEKDIDKCAFVPDELRVRKLRKSTREAFERALIEVSRWSGGNVQ